MAMQTDVKQTFQFYSPSTNGAADPHWYPLAVPEYTADSYYYYTTAPIQGKVRIKAINIGLLTGSTFSQNFPGVIKLREGLTGPVKLHMGLAGFTIGAPMQSQKITILIPGEGILINNPCVYVEGYGYNGPNLLFGFVYG
jgi:hypothetical protein